MDRFASHTGRDLPYRTKKFPAVLKEIEQGIIEGFAAIMGVVDWYEEVIDNGAFKKTLHTNRGRIALCWQHNWREPIGKPSVLKEVKADKLPDVLREKYPEATGGLYFKSKIVDTRQGRDAKVLIREGVVDEMSIGFDVPKGGLYDHEDGHVHLKEIELYEISPVTMAAMPAAVVTEYKGVEPPEPPQVRVEETDDYIHVPVRDVAQFVADSFRTIDLSKEQGIKAVIGKFKTDPQGPTHVQKCMFAKAKGWTVEKAKQWVAEHRDDLKTRATMYAVLGNGRVHRREVFGGWWQSDTETSPQWEPVEFDLSDPLYARRQEAVGLLEKGEYREAHRMLGELISELPQPTLGRAEELALRAGVLEAEISAL